MLLTAGSLAGQPRIRHAFFTREGGVSEGPFESLNMSQRGSDEPLRVARNRARAATRLGVAPEALLSARQVHGRTVVRVREPWAPDALPEADALVTTEPGLAIGVVSADCAPVLLADPVAGVVGAAHAGWRGALAGVLEACLEAMAAAGAEASRTVAAIGPCIHQASYEVGDDYRAAFIADDPAAARFFAADPATGRPRFDLAGYCRARLQGAGVTEVEILPYDTCARADLFFSNRRSSRLPDRRFGLQLSAIVLGGEGAHSP